MVVMLAAHRAGHGMTAGRHQHSTRTLSVRYADRIVLLIVCPLQFESSLLGSELSRLGVDAGAYRIECCGPGVAGIERWARSHALQLVAQSPVLLTGVAGALSADVRAGEACALSAVRSGSGETWTSPLTSRAISPSSHMVITSADAPVVSREERLALAQRTGAHLVDMESVAFARQAAACGWHWGIVRGVSDDLRTLAPEGMERWVDQRGRTRSLAVLAALARRPRLLRDLRCLHHNSRAALARAAKIIAALMRE